MTDRDVAVVGFAHAPHVRRTDGTTNGVEMLMPCFHALYEELGLEQPLGERGAVDLDEGLARAVRVGMNRPGDQLLSRPRFAED